LIDRTSLIGALRTSSALELIEFLTKPALPPNISLMSSIVVVLAVLGGIEHIDLCDDRWLDISIGS